MLVIFDWDGTLCDSTAKIVTCMQAAADQQGLPALSDDAVKNIIGLGLPEAIKTLYPELGGQQVNAMRQGYSEQYIQADRVPSQFFAGVEQVLDQLLSQGHKIAVATGKSRTGLNRVMQAMQVADLFHATRCADETISKPHPLMLQQLLDELGYEAQEAVMVGDTEFDMEMARRANMARIAVDFGAHHVDRLKPYEPMACLSSMLDILPVVQRFSAQ